MVVEKFCRKKKYGWTYPFAAPAAKILTDFRNRSYIRNCVAPELALNGREVVAQQLEYFRPVDNSAGAHLFFTAIFAPIFSLLFFTNPQRLKGYRTDRPLLFKDFPIAFSVTLCPCGE